MAARCPHCGGRPISWPDTRIIEACQQWTEKHGVPPTASAWRASTHEHPSESMVRRSFGTWNAMMVAAGYDGRDAFAPLRHHWTRETVVAKVYEFRYLNGRLPRWRDWRNAPVEGDWPTSWKVQRLFGSFAGAIVAAGYEPEYTRRSKRSLRAVSAAATKAAA